MRTKVAQIVDKFKGLLKEKYVLSVLLKDSEYRRRTLFFIGLLKEAVFSQDALGLESETEVIFK